MTDPAPAPHEEQPRVKKRWWLALGSGTLWISILVHLFLGLGATYFVVQHLTKKKHVDFVSAPPPAPATEVEHKVEMAKKDNVESAPPDLKRITTSGLSAIALPDVPDPPPTDDVTPSLMSGTGDIGSGLGGGNGTGGNGSGNPEFGSFGGNGLQGTLYDLKQTPERQPTSMAPVGDELKTTEEGKDGATPMAEAIRVLRDFGRNWDMSILEQYYKAPRQLVASQIFIPYLRAAKAPEAFQVQDTVNPRRWVVHYQAKITAPESGDYRFVGFADDFLLVRIGEENVLDGSYGGSEVIDESADTPATEAEIKAGIKLHLGTWVHMDSNLSTNMEVLIGEGPGGWSAFFLLVQKKGDDGQPGPLCVFQVQDTAVPPYASDPKNNGLLAGFNGNKMLFKVEASDALPPP